MDKKPKVAQKHGRPAEIRCNISGFETEEGGSGENDPLVPARAPPRPTTTTTAADETSVAVAALIALLMLVCLAAPLILPFMVPPPPIMSSKLHSFSLSPPNNSSTATCDAVLSVKKNNALCKHLSVDLAKASVLYREERIWEKVMEPFYLTEEEEMMININMSAGAALWQRVAAGEKSRHGTVELEFSVDAIGKADGEQTEKMTIEILCRDLKVGFCSNSEAAQMVDGPKKCRTKWLFDTYG